jgi:biopolymer transport protein ExbD
MIGPRIGARSRGPQLMAEINITPFTDVVLVLLIIFMLSASFIRTEEKQESLKVNLPAAATGEAQPRQDLVVTVRADGNVYIGRDRISLRDLPGALRARRGGGSGNGPIHSAASGASDLVIIQADQRVLYDRIVAVMDAVKLAGLDRIALATK